MDYEFIIADLERGLKPERFFHNLGALECAVSMALRFGVSPERAGLAAVLHDCARKYSKKEQWRLIEQWRVPAPPDARDYPSLWHAWLGPAVARRQYGLDDPEIEAAIYCHSTGKADMTPLEEVSFVANVAEPTRSFDGVETIRSAAREDLRLAVRICIEGTLEKLRETGKPMHPDGLAALGYYG